MNEYDPIRDDARDAADIYASLDPSLIRQPADRIRFLKNFSAVLARQEQKLIDAVNADIGRPPSEVRLTETIQLRHEVDFFVKKTKKLCRPRKYPSPTFLFGAKSTVVPEPYGRAYVISAFNFPVLLSLQPAVTAVAAGNSVIVRICDTVPTVCQAVRALFEEADPSHKIMQFVDVSHAHSDELTRRADFLCYTGSPKVARHIHSLCSENLVPCVLELGGKSPAIVESAPELASRRVVWTKVTNQGQICIAADYALVREELKDEFISQCLDRVGDFYGSRDPTEYMNSPDYTSRIITDAHVERLRQALVEAVDGGATLHGGTLEDIDVEGRRLPFFIVTGVPLDCALAREEIFGPILPVFTYSTIDEAIDFVREREKPLAIYLFSTDKEVIERVTVETSSGALCVNEVMSHAASNLPFGGVGNSGMGAYHGEFGFDYFSHMKPILTRGQGFEVDKNLRYPPHTPKKDRLRLKFM